MIKIRPQLPQHAFWQFSVQIYQQANVEQMCLKLQKKHGLNVNLLLFCCWVGYQGYGRLHKKDFARALTATNRWHELVTIQLRQVRRRIKQLTGVKQPYAFAFETEMAAEQTEQLLLAQTLQKHQRPNNKAEKRFADAFANLIFYLRLLKIAFDDEDTTALYTLLSPLFPELPPMQRASTCRTLIHANPHKQTAFAFED